MNISAGIAAVTQAITIAKTLRSIEKSYDEATLKAQLAELVSALADAKLALTEAKESHQKKDKMIAKLKASFEAHGDLITSDGGYKFFVGEDGNPLGYPVCPKCEIDGKLVQLKQNGGAIQARCPSCLTEFQPVTCFLPPEDGYGPTLLGKQNKLKAEGWDRLSEKMARLDRGYV